MISYLRQDEVDQENASLANQRRCWNHFYYPSGYLDLCPGFPRSTGVIH